MSDGGTRRTPRRKTPEQQAKLNAHLRVRYATDPTFRERMKARARATYRANPRPYKERAARRRSLRLERDERPAVRHLYALRDIATEILGVRVVVMHRVSLKNGGAHRLANLALGTFRANARMGSRNEADIPPEWRTYVHIDLPDMDGVLTRVPVLVHELDQIRRY